MTTRSMRKAWHNMRNRCAQKAPTCTRIHYWDRGIRVCERWNGSFEAFAADMGLPPDASKTSLDRIDVNGNYEPGNVRWATAKEQGRNRRKHHWVSVDGKNITISEYAERLGIKPNTLYYRIKRAKMPKSPTKDPRRSPGRFKRLINLREELISARVSGESLPSIGRRYGVDGGQLSRFFAFLHVAPAAGCSYSEKKAIQTQRMMAMRAAGKSLSEIARAEGLSTSSVWNRTNYKAKTANDRLSL